MAMFLDLPGVELPGPRTIPGLGPRINLLRFFGDPVATMMRLRAQYGDVAALSRNHAGWVCAFGAEHNQRVLSDSAGFHNFVESPMRGPEGSPAAYLDRNLVSQNGEVHRRNRRMLMTGFSKDRLYGYGERMVEVAARRLSSWPTQGSVDLRTEMVELSLEVAMSCLFGLDLQSGARELGMANKRFMELVLSPAAILFQVPLPGTPYAEYLAVSERLGTLMGSLIERRRREGLGTDVFSALLEASVEGEGFPEGELLGQASMLVAASHETTAAALAWTTLLLATHPKTQLDLAAEVDAVLGGAPPTLDDLERMPLLGWVVDESLRLLPPTPIMFFRRSAGGFELGGHAMPAGTTILLSSVLTHRDRDLYPDPKRFKPRRWEGLRVGPYEYLPFGAGPRRCLGAGFAGQALRLIIAMVLQRKRLSLPRPTKIDYKVGGIIMGPRDALKLAIGRPEDGVPAPGQVSGGVLRLVDF